MVKKSNCEKCGLCKQIYWHVNKMVRCEKYGEMDFPTHCDRFITIEEYKRQQELKEDYERQIRHFERIWSIIEMKETK